MSILSTVRRFLHPIQPLATGETARELPGLDREFLFRRFSFGRDADVICRFQRETYEMNFPGFLVDQAFLIGFRYDLRRATSDPNHALFVIERNREPVAFLWVVTHENSWTGERSGYVNNIYVAPSMRGRGLAKFLMAQCAEHFRVLGLVRIRLEVTECNEAAVQLYRAAGYEVTRFVMEKEIAED